MVNEDVYQQIFAGVSSRSDLAHAIARAVRQLREAMEKEDNCAVTAAHVRNLKEIDPAALATAYALAEKTCTFWPTPGQMRELAGSLIWQSMVWKDARTAAGCGSERTRPGAECCWKQKW
jgi:hypothetical protein